MDRLQANLQRLEKAMAASDDFNERHSAQAQRLARSAAALAAEVRQREKQAERDAEAETQEEMLADVAAYVAGLPAPVRADFVAKLVRQEKQLGGPAERRSALQTEGEPDR